MLTIQYRNLSVEGHLIPYIIFKDSNRPEADFVSAMGFPIPKNSKEAISYAIQSLSRFFERIVGAEKVPVFNEETLNRKRELRRYVHALSNIDVTNIPFEHMADGVMAKT